MDERKILDIEIKIVRDVKTLLSIKDIWHQLEENSKVYPFNTFEWVVNWWKYFGGGKKLWILLVVGDQGPIGIAPFMITFGEMGLPIKRIKFIGSNNSDYLDFIVKYGYEDIFYRSLIKYLESAIDRFTVLDLEHLPESSGIYPYIMDSWLYYDYDIQDVCPYIKLPATWDEYLSTLDGKFRRNIKYEIKRFFTKCDGSFMSVADENDIDDSMDRLIELHQARWRKRHMPGAFYSKRVRDFHKALAFDFFNRGILSLFELKDGDKIVASLLSYHVGGKRYYYISGYDLDYSRLSVGAVTLGLSIKRSIEVGDEVYDFLRGDEKYKEDWTKDKKRNMRLVASYPSVAGRFYLYYIIAENKIINKIKDRFSHD
ncbi:GNAT family N-acetyltransferase [Thermoanaerobacterium thermosulfurigenes]|uniref:GNAT family N-acetyltransferase n=1 Tax=Thermoanaerobacterium thermosulfurigenes TaxID=33950 RepID=UPI003EF17BFB